MAGQARKQESIQKMQIEFDYRQSLRQQDMQIDLQMQERAKQWEVDKMQLRSQIDFQREEQKRQRELDGYDNVELQIKKEIQAGRMTDKEAEPYLLKNDLARQGMNISVSEIQRQKEDGRTGVSPFWTEWLKEPEGSARRIYAEKKLAADERGGTVPYYLDPSWLRETDRDVVEQVLMSREIFFDSPQDLDAFIQRAGEGVPLGNKQLDIGVRAEPTVTGTEGGRIRVISPGGQAGTILESELQEYLDQGFEVVGEQKAFRGAGAQGTWEETVPKRVKRKSRLGTINWNRLMSKGFK